MIGCLTETTTCVVAKPLVFFKVIPITFDYFFFQAILSEPSWILIIFYILLEYKNKKVEIAILELKNPYEQIFVETPCIINLD